MERIEIGHGFQSKNIPGQCHFECDAREWTEGCSGELVEGLKMKMEGNLKDIKGMQTEFLKTSQN